MDHKHKMGRNNNKHTNKTIKIHIRMELNNKHQMGLNNNNHTTKKIKIHIRMEFNNKHKLGFNNKHQMEFKHTNTTIKINIIKFNNKMKINNAKIPIKFYIRMKKI